jgi:hypothetical protein
MHTCGCGISSIRTIDVNERLLASNAAGAEHNRAHLAERKIFAIVQPETVSRWRREGWSALWRYRSPDRWRGGRPRVSGEVRHLIVRMARENFLWGTPRIHGELLMRHSLLYQLHFASGRNGRAKIGNRDIARELRFIHSKVVFSATTHLQMRPLWRALQ